MNKLFKSIVAASVGVAMAIGVGAGLGREVKAVYAESDTFVPDAASISRTGFTIAVAKGSGGTNPVYTSGTKTRVYPKNTVTLTAQAGYVITGWSIAGTVNANNKGVYPTGWTITDGSSQLAGDDIAATGSETFSISNQSKSTLVFSCSGSAGNIDLTSMTVSYGPDASNNPFISFSKEDISGEEGESFSFTYSAEHLTDVISWSPASGDTEIINYSVNTSTKTVSGTLTKAGSVTLTATSGTASDSITFNVSVPFISKDYKLCKSIDDLEVGDSIIIGNGTEGSVAFLSSTQNTNNRGATDGITVTADIVSSTANIEVLTLGESNSNWTLYATINEGYLYAASSSANHLKTRSQNSDANSEWAIEIDSNGVASITAQGTNTRNQLKNNGTLFACYSSGQTDVSIWKEYSNKQLVSLTVTGSPTKLSGYYDTDSFNPEGITSYVAVYDDNSTKTLSAGSITWPKLVAGMTSIRGSYSEGDNVVYTPAYTIAAVQADTVSSISLSGAIVSSYDLNGNWDKGNLIVTANYVSGKTKDVTDEATIKYYSDSAMTNEILSPAALGVVTNQTVYVKATYSGVSNLTGYSQIISVLNRTTVTKTIVEAFGSIADGTKVLTFNLDSVVTVSTTEGQYNGSFYTNGGDWRIYHSENAVVTISVSKGHLITSVTFTYTGADNGELLYGETVVTSNSAVNIDSLETVNFSASSSSGAKGKSKITAISVTYIVDDTVTAEDMIESEASYAKLSYDYSKNGSAIADKLNRDACGVLSGNYTTWENNVVLSSGVAYQGRTAGGNNSIQLKSDDNSGIVVVSNTGTNLNAKKIVVKWNTATTDGRSIDVYGSENAYSSSSDLYGENAGTLIGALTYEEEEGVITELSISENYKFIGFKSAGNALYADSIVIEWGETPNSYSYTDVAIRFGGRISKSLWTDLNDNVSAITHYGVLLSTPGSFAGVKLATETNYANASETSGAPLRKFEASISRNPTEDGDDYYWNVYKTISASNLTQEYVAVAYIKLNNGDIVFLKEVSASAKGAAASLIKNTYDIDAFEGSLASLALK